MALRSPTISILSALFLKIYIIIHLTSTRSTMYGLLIFLSKINGLLDINEALIVN